jgi:hypothetical protein
MHELLIIEHLLIILDEILPSSSEIIESEAFPLPDGDDDEPEE